MQANFLIEVDQDKVLELEIACVTRRRIRDVVTALRPQTKLETSQCGTYAYRRTVTFHDINWKLAKKFHDSINRIPHVSIKRVK